MNVWIRHGLRTALLTGGLLAAGSGTASADDSIEVTVPVTVTDNAVAVLGASPGTTAPEVPLPAVEALVHVDLGAASVSAPVTVGGNSVDIAGLDVAQPAGAPAPAADGGHGSAVDADVPVTVSGNAAAVLGEATARGDAGPPAASGIDAALLNVDAPVTVCGNAVAVLGEATADCTATDPGTGGPSTGGTTPLVDVDAPVGVCGNGVGVLGDAAAGCTAPAAGGLDLPASPVTGPTGGTVRPARSDVAVDATPGVVGTGVVPAGRTAGTAGALGTVSTTAAALGTALGTSAGPGAGTGSAAGRPGGVLAWTGADVVPLALGGLLALLLGLGIAGRARRGGVAG